MATKNHDPAQYSFVFHGILLQGYHNGTFISVARQSDTYSDDVGADGDVVRTKSHDRRATITVTLQKSSPVNDLLSVIQVVGEGDDNVDGDVDEAFLKDNNGTTVGNASEAWIMKAPDLDVATEHTPVVWVFRAAKWKQFTGGKAR